MLIKTKHCHGTVYTSRAQLLCDSAFCKAAGCTPCRADSSHRNYSSSVTFVPAAHAMRPIQIQKQMISSTTYVMLKTVINIFSY